MTDKIDLGDFEGKPVLVASVAVTNAGDGLSDALGVDPQILHQGDRGAILLEYEVAKVRFDPVKDTNGLARVHILKASTGTLLDLEEVQERLDAQRRRIEEAEGTLQLDLEGGEPQSVGEVLDDVIDMTEGVEAEARAARMAELHQWEKDDLVDHLEKLGCEFDPDSMQTTDLVEEIVQWEEAASA